MSDFGKEIQAVKLALFSLSRQTHWPDNFECTRENGAERLTYRTLAVTVSLEADELTLRGSDGKVIYAGGKPIALGGLNRTGRLAVMLEKELQSAIDGCMEREAGIF